MIKIVGLSAVGLATIVPPSTDTYCYQSYTSGLLPAVCNAIQTTFATSGSPVARCAADTTAIMAAAGVQVDDSGTYSMAQACALWAPTDCITTYCCGGPSGTGCGYFGPSSDASSQCNSANMLENFVYFGSAAAMANPPANIAQNRCYGRTPGATFPYDPFYPIYPVYPYNWNVVSVSSCLYNTTMPGNVATQVSGLIVNGTCYPIGTPVYNNCGYYNCGYLYPVNYYNYESIYNGQYVDQYGNMFTGDYYLYYGYYGYGGYDMWGWQGNCGYGSGWGINSWCGGSYGWSDVYYWQNTYGCGWNTPYAGCGGYYLQA
jgi:hypothetical protein